MLQFKNDGGTHVQNDADGKQREYKHGEIIETDIELDVIYGAKFKRLNAPQKQTRKRLEDYSDKDLRGFATDNGIEIEEGDDKTEIIRALREAGL